MIEGVKKKIVLADQKDRQQIGEDLPVIFQEDLDSYLKKLEFNGASLIKMLEKNEKLIFKQVDEAKDAFDTFLQETRAFANLKMKQIFSRKKDLSSDVLPKEKK